MNSAKGVRSGDTAAELLSGKKLLDKFQGWHAAQEMTFHLHGESFVETGLRCAPESYREEPDVLRDIGVWGIGRVFERSGVSGVASLGSFA